MNLFLLLISELNGIFLDFSFSVELGGVLGIIW